MSKYIDAEDIASTIRKVRTKFAIDSVFGENLREDAAVAGALEAVAQVIDILPAADVQEVRHGRWIEEDDAIIHGHCSSCGWNAIWQETDVFGMPYCPNCGSRMDLEGEEK